ncbi:hypothetical protein [uncultured Streptomyces sp.]|uniref:hypothetical protein n=1 Tax=uncultured Streptomyces sp. TaxID=174707 RepID=UPI0026111C85|nr:hypothetical protein [uncultured Streptomyces sp.]
MGILVRVVVIGALFGIVTSVADAMSSPFMEWGEPLAGTVWGRGAKVLSLVLGGGWAWAALAVGAGWLARTPGRGALAGALALFAATGAYYWCDSWLGETGGSPFLWWVVGTPMGLLLGLVGTAVRRPGLVGLAAASVVPAGAAAQMILMPPRPHMTVTPGIVVAETLVWAVAVAGAGWAVYRFRTGRSAAADGMRGARGAAAGRNP